MVECGYAWLCCVQLAWGLPIVRWLGYFAVLWLLFPCNPISTWEQGPPCRATSSMVAWTSASLGFADVHQIKTTKAVFKSPRLILVHVRAWTGGIWGKITSGLRPFLRPWFDLWPPGVHHGNALGRLGCRFRLKQANIQHIFNFKITLENHFGRS